MVDATVEAIDRTLHRWQVVAERGEPIDLVAEMMDLTQRNISRGDHELVSAWSIAWQTPARVVRRLRITAAVIAALPPFAARLVLGDRPPSTAGCADTVQQPSRRDPQRSCRSAAAVGSAPPQARSGSRAERTFHGDFAPRDP
jgi:hypothetical protein